MVRTQLYLDDSVHARLRQLASRQGRTVSDLVREAIARTIGASDAGTRISSLDGITGLWRDRHDIEAADAYVRRLRRNTRRLTPDR